MQKDVYIAQTSGIIPYSQIKNKSKASLKNRAMNIRRNLKFLSKVWHRTIQKETQWSRTRKITRFNNSLITSETQQFELRIKHHKLITYTYTYICVQYLTGCRSLDHTISKQRNKIYSIQGREPTQGSSQT